MRLGRTFGSAAAAGVLALFALAPSRAHATPQDIFGFGARSPGLGLTGVSYADDYEAAFLNPAGLARARAREVVIGFSAGTFQLAVDGDRYPAEASRGMTIGFTLPLPFGDVLENRLVLGGGFFTPSSVLLEGLIPPVYQAQFNVLERVQAAAIMVGLGIDFHDLGVLDGLRIGASVSVAANVVGELAVRLDETSAFVSTVETQLVATYAPIIGATYERERWGVGLAYRFELAGEVDLAIAADDLPVEVPALRVGGVVHYDPAALVGEGFVRVLPDLMVAVQLQGRFWGNYPGPQRQVTETSTQPPRPDYTATVSPRLGVEGKLRDENFELAIRGGYAFEPTPASPARMLPMLDSMGMPTMDLVPLRYVDNHRHVLTLGAGVSHDFGGGVRLRLDAFGQLQVLMARTHEVGVDDTSPPMRTSGTMLAGGFTFGLSFR